MLKKRATAVHFVQNSGAVESKMSPARPSALNCEPGADRLGGDATEASPPARPLQSAPSLSVGAAEVSIVARKRRVASCRSSNHTLVRARQSSRAHVRLACLPTRAAHATMAAWMESARAAHNRALVEDSGVHVIAGVLETQV